MTAGIGYGMGAAGGKMFPHLGKLGQGAVSAMSGGVVGGLSSVAMGGSFNEGFKIGFISAGLSYAGNEVARAIELNNAVQVAGKRLNQAVEQSNLPQGTKADIQKQIPTLLKDMKDWIVEHGGRGANRMPNAGDFELVNGRGLHGQVRGSVVELYATEILDPNIGRSGSGLYF